MKSDKYKTGERSKFPVHLHLCTDSVVYGAEWCPHKTRFWNAYISLLKRSASWLCRHLHINNVNMTNDDRQVFLRMWNCWVRHEGECHDWYARGITCKILRVLLMTLGNGWIQKPWNIVLYQTQLTDGYDFLFFEWLLVILSGLKINHWTEYIHIFT